VLTADHSQGQRSRNRTGRTRSLGIALLCALACTSCIAPPEPGERGALAGARRILAMDFSKQAASRRADELARWQRWLGKEFRRRPSASPSGVKKELYRTESLFDTGLAIASPELRRRPRDLTFWLPKQGEFAEDVANDLDLAVWMLGTTRRPMGEIDDRMHRTRPDDNRPEASLWQRLRRRLRL